MVKQPRESVKQKKSVSYNSFHGLDPKKTALNPFDVLPKVNKLFVSKEAKKLKIWDTCVAIITIIELLLFYEEHELYFKNGNESRAANHVLRSIIMLLNFIGALALYKRYEKSLRIKKFKGKQAMRDNLFRTGDYKKFFPEVALMVLSVPPGLDLNFEVNQLGFTSIYTVDAIVFSLNLLKFYHVLRLFQHYSFYTNQYCETIW